MDSQCGFLSGRSSTNQVFTQHKEFYPCFADQPSPLRKALSNVAGVRRWQPLVTGRQVSVVLLRSFMSVPADLYHNRSSWLQSRHHAVTFVGLSSHTKLQAPRIEIWNARNQLSFYQSVCCSVLQFMDRAGYLLLLPRTTSPDHFWYVCEVITVFWGLSAKHHHSLHGVLEVKLAYMPQLYTSRSQTSTWSTYLV